MYESGSYYIQDYPCKIEAKTIIIYGEKEKRNALKIQKFLKNKL